MNDTNSNLTTGRTMVVTLTVDQLQNLIREEVEAALRAEPDQLLTAEELAERLKVPVSWVYEQSRQGKIPTVRVGRYVRFSLTQVLKSLKTNGDS